MRWQASSRTVGRGRVGDAQVRAEAEGRTVHGGDALGLQQLGDEILVGLEHLAGGRGLAHRLGAGRIDVECPLGHRAFEIFRLVQHRHHEVAAFLERLPETLR